MTKHSRAWRNKKIHKIRVYKKIHNSFLGAITMMMFVFFLLSLCAEVNNYTTAMFVVSIMWLMLVGLANDAQLFEEGEE